MASENADVVRRLLEAFGRDDTDAQLAILHPDVELTEWPDSPSPQTFRGHAGALQARESWAEAWEWLRNEVEEMIEAGDKVITCGRTVAKGKGSTIEVGVDAFNVYTVQGGKITRMEFFTEKEQALSAAGLRQSATKSEESR